MALERYGRNFENPQYIRVQNHPDLPIGQSVLTLRHSINV